MAYAETVIGTDTGISLRDWINTLKSDKGLGVGGEKVIKLLTRKYLYRAPLKQFKPEALVPSCVMPEEGSPYI